MISLSLVSIDVQQNKLASFSVHTRLWSLGTWPDIGTLLPGGLPHVAEVTCTRAEVVALKAGRANGPREQYQTVGSQVRLTYVATVTLLTHYATAKSYTSIGTRLKDITLLTHD